MTPEIRADALVQGHFGQPHHVWRAVLSSAIREAETAARADEREACAKIADEAEQRNWHGDGERTAPEDIAAAIRARGK